MKVKNNINERKVSIIRSLCLILGPTIIFSILTYEFLSIHSEEIIKILQEGLLSDFMKFLAPVYLVIFGLINLIYEIVFSLNKKN